MKSGSSTSDVVVYARSGVPFVVEVTFYPIITESLYGETNMTQLFCFMKSTSQQSFLSSNIRRLMSHEDDASELTRD